MDFRVSERILLLAWFGAWNEVVGYAACDGERVLVQGLQCRLDRKRSAICWRCKALLVSANLALKVPFESSGAKDAIVLLAVFTWLECQNRVKRLQTPTQLSSMASSVDRAADHAHGSSGSVVLFILQLACNCAILVESLSSGMVGSHLRF